MCPEQRFPLNGTLGKARILKKDKIPTTEDFLPCVGTPRKTGFSRISGNLQPDQMEVMDE